MLAAGVQQSVGVKMKKHEKKDKHPKKEHDKKKEYKKHDPKPKAKKMAGGKVEKVMHEFKVGKLHSGSKKGPLVKSRAQGIAIALSEARKAGAKIKPAKP